MARRVALSLMSPANVAARGHEMFVKRRQKVHYVNRERISALFKGAKWGQIPKIIMKKHLITSQLLKIYSK